MISYPHKDGFSVSVIIPNFNYEEFIGPAIDSALALDWPSVEIIVVDDGSTDGSRDVVARYADKGVTLIAQQNAGPAAACNAGFARSSGDVIVFLDSDDLLAPSLIREVAAVLTPETSKVQVQMQTVDSLARPLPNTFPKFDASISPARIRTWAQFAGAYPTPPGSGNVYTRTFLEKLFPLDLTMDRATDSYCLATAPFLGDVVTIPKPLVSYRVHGRNLAAMASLNEARFGKEIVRALRRREYSVGVAAANGIAIRPDSYRYSLGIVALRAASLALTPDTHPLPSDSRWRAFRDAVRAASTPQGNSLRAQASLFLWATSILLTPRAVARTMVRWRYVPAARPAFVNRIVARL